MTCKEMEKKLIFYLDGELEASEVEAVEYHLEICPHCEKELEEIQESYALFSQAPEVSLPSNFHRQLQVAIATESNSKSSALFSPSKLTALAAAAVFLLCASSIYWWSQSGLRESSPPLNPDRKESRLAPILSQNRLQTLGLDPQEEREIVENLHLLKEFPTLTRAEFLDNMNFLDSQLFKEYPLDDI